MDVLKSVCGMTLAASMALALPTPARAQATVAAIKARGALNCGIDTGVPGFAYQEKSGRWVGFDVDYCRAIAAAVLGDPEKVKFLSTTAKVRFVVLKNGEIDALIRDTTLTFTRSNELKLAETVVNFYTGQAFMAKKSLNARTVKDLDGATVCLVTGATLDTNITDYNRAHDFAIHPMLFDRVEDAFKAIDQGQCDAYTDDGGSVAAVRSTMKDPQGWDIIEEVISKEPLGIHTRQGDENWSDIARWLHYGLLTAEEHGVTKANADQQAKTSSDPTIRRLLGVEGNFGKMLGLDDVWMLRAIKAVGNYGEIYDRHFGAAALDLPRGLNKLWTQGGLQYALPWR